MAEIYLGGTSSADKRRFQPKPCSAWRVVHPEVDCMNCGWNLEEHEAHWAGRPVEPR